MSFKKFIRITNIVGIIVGTIVLLALHFVFRIPLFISFGVSLIGYVFPILNWIWFHGIDLK